MGYESKADSKKEGAELALKQAFSNQNNTDLRLNDNVFEKQLKENAVLDRSYFCERK